MCNCFHFLTSRWNDDYDVVAGGGNNQKQHDHPMQPAPRSSAALNGAIVDYHCLQKWGVQDEDIILFSCSDYYGHHRRARTLDMALFVSSSQFQFQSMSIIKFLTVVDHGSKLTLFEVHDSIPHGTVAR